MVCWMLNALKDDLMYKAILSLLQIKHKFKKIYIQKICDKLRIATKSEMYKAQG